MGKKAVIGVFVLITGMGQSFAQTATHVLTFEEAVRLAMQNSVTLNTQRNNLSYSQMQKTAAYSGLAPSVSLNSTASRIDGNSFNPNTGTVVNGIRDNISGTINANVNIFSGFWRMNLIKQYANQLDAQSYFVNRTAQDVINTVSNQYLRVMLDVELLKIARQNYESQQRQYEQVREQVSLGGRSPVDEYNQDALAKAAELRMVQAEIALNNDKALLSQTLLLDPFDAYDVELPNWDVNVIGNQIPNATELAERAKQFRGDYLRAEKNEEAQRFAMQASRGLMAPSLYAFGTIGSAYNFQHGISRTILDSLGNPVDNPAYPRPFDEQFKTNNVYKSYGLQLQIPIFNGLQNRTAMVQQKVLYDNAQLTRKNLELQIRNDVVRAVNNYEGAKKAYGVSIDQLKAAEQAFSLETERYNLGVTNFVDYTNANRAFVQAQTDKAQAEYTLVFQRILLEYAVGTLKPEDLVKQQ